MRATPIWQRLPRQASDRARRGARSPGIHRILESRLCLPEAPGRVTAQKQLLELGQNLPAEMVREVVDFAEFLAAKSGTRLGNGASSGTKALRRYIGGVKHGTLASGIDDELYGRPVR